MRQGSSSFTNASARAFSLATSNELGVDVNTNSLARSILVLTLTRTFLDSTSTMWPRFRCLEEHKPSDGLLLQTAHRQNLLVS